MNPLWLLKIFGMVSGVNIKKVLGYIASYWKIFLIAVLGVIVWYQNYSDIRFMFGSQTIPALESELVESQNNLRICGDGNAKLSAAIDKNNARNEEYERLTKDLEASIILLGNELTQEREETDKEVETILKDPTPKSCEKAMDYLRDGTKDLKW